MNIFLLIHSSAFVVSGFLIKHLNLSVESILMIDQECVILSNNNFKLLNNYKPSRYLRTFLYSHSQVPLKLLCSSVSILSWNIIDIANQQMIYTDLNNYICVQFPKHEYLTWEWTSSSHSPFKIPQPTSTHLNCWPSSSVFFNTSWVSKDTSSDVPSDSIWLIRPHDSWPFTLYRQW